MKSKLIKSYVDRGICKINIDEVIKEFKKNISISKWINNKTNKNEYTLVNNKLKIRISGGDAELIIHRLGLKEIKSAIFSSGSNFR